MEAVAFLFEALALNRTLAAAMLQDPDLQPLALDARPPPDPARLRQVLSQDHITAPRILMLTRVKGIDTNVLAQILAVLVRHYAGTSGGP